MYRNELTVTYDAPKPVKKLFTDEDLYKADLFSFGSAIGSITNKGTNAYALLPLIEAEFGKGSEEYKILFSRLQQCCVAQSRGIDRAKIGQKVKGIPEVWTRRQRISPEETDEQRAYKELMNRILIDRRPYFFKYRYSKSRSEWRDYERERNGACFVLFGMSIKELEDQPHKTPEQQEWLRDYHQYAPLVMSDSPMNLVCCWIEKQNFEIQKHVREQEFDWKVYLSDVPEVSDEDYELIVKCYKRHQQDIAGLLSYQMTDVPVSGSDYYETNIVLLRERMSYICSNPCMVANALLKYLYTERSGASKGILWDAYGRYMVEAARMKSAAPALLPAPCDDGDITYLGKGYRLMEVDWE